MAQMEVILQNITEKVFSAARSQSDNATRPRMRSQRIVFYKALNKAMNRVMERFPDEAKDLLYSHFLEKEGAAILAQSILLETNNPLDPGELAMLWADSLNPRQQENEKKYICQLEPVTAEFLDVLNSYLYHETQELYRFWYSEEQGPNLPGKQKSLSIRSGLRRDYLRWLSERSKLPYPSGLAELQTTLDISLDDFFSAYSLKRVDQGSEEVISLSQVLHNYPALVILGDGGSGKTTLLQYVVVKITQALLNNRELTQNTFPLYLPLFLPAMVFAERDIESNEAFASSLDDYCQHRGLQVPGLRSLFQEELSKGKCLILLDGLDEIADLQKRRQVVDRLNNFAKIRGDGSVYPNRFILTSRPAHYAETQLHPPFVDFFIQEMNERQIQQFLKRLLLAQSIVQMPDMSRDILETRVQFELENFLRVIKGSPAIRSLAVYPSFLSILVLVSRQMGGFSARGEQLLQKRVEFYKQASEALLNNWPSELDTTTFRTSLLTNEYITRILGKLAYWLRCYKEDGIATVDEVYQVLYKEWAIIDDLSEDDQDAETREEIKVFLRTLYTQIGILVECSQGMLCFFHRVFEEYYAARYLVARQRDRTWLISQHLHDPRWDEPILLALGYVGLSSMEDVSDLLKTAILAQGEMVPFLEFRPEDSIQQQNFLFALRCLGENIPLSPQLVSWFVERLKEQLLYHTGPAKMLGYRKKLEKSVVLLRDSWVAQSLSEALVSYLHDVTSDTVLLRAVIHLQQLGFVTSPDVVQKLVQILSGKNEKVQSAVVTALGHLGLIMGQYIAARYDDTEDIPTVLSPLQEKLELIVATLHEALSVRTLSVQRKAQKNWQLLVEGVPESVMVSMLRSVSPLHSAAVEKMVREQCVDPFFHLWSYCATSSFAKVIHNFVSYLAMQTKMTGMHIVLEKQGYILIKLNATHLFRYFFLPDIEIVLLFVRRNALRLLTPESLSELLTGHLGYRRSIVLTTVFGPGSAVQRARAILAAANKLPHNMHEYVLLARTELKKMIDSADLEAALRHQMFQFIDLAGISPYTITGPASGSMFFGRRKELNRIKNGILSTSYALIGGNSLGKTSILHRLYQLLREGNESSVVYFFSCRSIGKQRPTMMDFLGAIMSSWKPVVSSPTLVSLRDIVSVLAQDDPGKSFIFLLDDVDELILADKEIGWHLFSDIRDLEKDGRCRFVFTGQDELQDAVRDPECPFHDFITELLLNRFDKQDAAELITGSLKDLLELELENETALARRIYRLTAGHPNIIQRFCHRLISHISQTGQRRITLADVEQVAAVPFVIDQGISLPGYVVEDLLPLLWVRTTLLERIIVLILARQEERAYTRFGIDRVLSEQSGMALNREGVDQALRRLVDLRHILRTAGTHYVFVFQECFSAFNALFGEASLKALIEYYTTSGDVLPDVISNQWMIW